MDDRERQEIIETPRSELKHIHTAIVRRYDIPDVVMKKLPLQMALIVQNSQYDRNKIAAAKVLMAMNEFNHNGGESNRSPIVNVGVNVNNNVESQRSRLRQIAAEYGSDKGVSGPAAGGEQAGGD